MLFTCCPECRTTFRVTAGVLRKAGGQVRCGRCGVSFDAFAELREEPAADAQAPRAEMPPRGDPLTRTDEFPACRPAGEQQQLSHGEAPAETDTPKIPVDDAASSRSSARTGDEPGRRNGTADVERIEDEAGEAGEEYLGEEYLGEEYLGEELVADEHAQPARGELFDGGPEAATRDSKTEADTEAASAATGHDADGEEPAAAADEEPAQPRHERPPPDATAEAAATTASGATPSDERSDDTSITPEEIEAVLLPETEAEQSETARWHFDTDESAILERPRARRGWRAAAILTALALLLQIVHHFRADLATYTDVRPLLEAAYGQLGVEIVPRWDLEQYEIMDWVAAAEPNARGQGSLSITARIRNAGPAAQPYPQVKLELKDRWEAVVGRRIFRPEEYLPADAEPNAMLAAGETIEATLDVVDPGPDAYGFELDVCVATNAASLQCANDNVFL